MHKTVNHSTGEFVQDEDDDGFHEVHVNTMEGFFEFVHNVRKEEKLCWIRWLKCLLDKIIKSRMEPSFLVKNPVLLQVKIE